MSLLVSFVARVTKPNDNPWPRLRAESPGGGGGG